MPLHGRRTTALLILVVLSNVDQTVSGKISTTQAAGDGNLKVGMVRTLTHDDNIHGTLNRRVRMNNEENAVSSGNGEGGEQRVKIRDIHYQVFNKHRAQDTSDDESSGDNGHKGKDHFHDGNTETKAEFGFITEEDEAEFPEDIEEGAFSGRQSNSQERLRVLHAHRGEKHVIRPRDYTEDKEEGDEVSGTGDSESKNVDKKRDLHLPHSTNIEGNKSKKRKVNLLTEEQRTESESGEDEERLSGGGEKASKERDEEMNATQSRDLNHLNHPFGSKSGRSSRRKVAHLQKQQETRDRDAKIKTKKDLNGENDFYIEENDEPKEKLYVVEIQDFGDGTKSGERGKDEDEPHTGNTETVQRFRRGPYRHLLQFQSEENIPTPGYIQVSSVQCSHPAVPEKIDDDTIIYLRDECRLCHCKTGELICAVKPQSCDQHRTNRSCSMANGEIADGERHFDGCNHCLCRNGELLCTRVRCPSANYNYTHYPKGISDTQENGPSVNALNWTMRGKDSCMECDYDPIFPVCGPNWKTYRSMCHALYCGDLRIEDVKEGSCETMNPCDDAKCPDHEICVAKIQGPCLTSTTTDGDIVECPQYQCVNPSKDCGADLDSDVCGEDQKTYKSECALSTRGISLAYYGPCKGECFVDDTRMCGVDGVTFTSSCHAARLNSHVDYPGPCDQVDPKNNVMMNSKDPGANYNRRCKTVEELARCPEIACSKHVISEGSCCRACGTAISIRLDIAAKDMATLKIADDKPYYNLNRLDLIHNTLKSLLNLFPNGNRCQLTTDLVDTNDISVVFSSIKPEDLDICDQVARKTVDFINSPSKNDLDPGQALLAAAVVVEQSEENFVLTIESVASVMVKRRMRRASHHEHEPMFSHNTRICPQNIIFLFLVTVGFHWTKNLAEN